MHIIKPTLRDHREFIALLLGFDKDGAEKGKAIAKNNEQNKP